jgi:hypothetical protein
VASDPGNEMLKTIQEQGIVLLVDVIGVPKVGLAYALSVAMTSEPGLRHRVEARFTIVAEQRDGCQRLVP